MKVLDLNLREIPRSVMRVTDVQLPRVDGAMSSFLLGKETPRRYCLRIIDRVQRSGMIYIQLLRCYCRTDVSLAPV